MSFAGRQSSAISPFPITMRSRESTPGPLLGARPAEGASVNLSTGHVSFEVEGLVLNGANATGTRDGVDQVEGSLICDAGQQNQTIFTTRPVPLVSRRI